MTIWIKELLNNLDLYIYESTREKILGACGGKCPFTHLTDEKLLKIKEESNSETDFLDKLCKQWRMKFEDGQYLQVIMSADS